MRKNAFDLVGIAAVVVLAIAGLMLLRHGEPQDGSTKDVRKQRTDVQTSTSELPLPAGEAAVPDVAKRERKTQVRPIPEAYRDNKNIRFDEDGLPHFVPTPGHRHVTNGLHRAKAKYEIFRHPSENMLAAYITAKPGEMFLGRVPCNDALLADIEAALEEPIAVEEGDDDEARELKRRVQEVKDTLKGMIDEGGDALQILQETREELQSLGIYKLTLEEELHKISRNGEMSDEYVTDFFEAANKMLEEKGIAPIEAGRFSRVLIKNAYPEEEEGEE